MNNIATNRKEVTTISKDQSTFSFELNESLFFEKGNEIEEIRAISLDPKISIQSFNDYISIRGVVELTGEFEKKPLLPEESLASFDIDDAPQSQRYIEKVVDSEGDLSTFYHRFPVEISVPTYRVDNLDDVTVSISSFDYELPKSSQLILMSVIDIHGINDTVEQTNDLEDDREEDINENIRSEDDSDQVNDQPSLDTIEIDDTFEFEVKEKPDLVERTVEEASEQDPLTFDTEIENEPEVSTDVDKNEDTNEKRLKKTTSQTLSEFFGKENEQETEMDTSKYLHEEEEIDAEEQDISTNDSEEEFSESDGYDEDGIELRYLSELVRGEDEQFTKMRLCIVQEEDTLSTIAKRYETTTMHIIAQNRLEEESISEGQLLHIPYRKKDE